IRSLRIPRSRRVREHNLVSHMHQVRHAIKYDHAVQQVRGAGRDRAGQDGLLPVLDNDPPPVPHLRRQIIESGGHLERPHIGVTHHHRAARHGQMPTLYTGRVNRPHNKRHQTPSKNRSWYVSRTRVSVDAPTNVTVNICCPGSSENRGERSDKSAQRSGVIRPGPVSIRTGGDASNSPEISITSWPFEIVKSSPGPVTCH